MAEKETGNVTPSGLSNEDEELRNLSRAECCTILGLPEDADDESIRQRYGALLRQYKRKVDEYGTTYDDLAYYKRITAAYDTVFGFTHDFSDDNPTSPVPYKVRKKWAKFIAWLDQYKLAVFLGAVIIFLAVMFTVQTLNHGKTDIKIKFVGAFAQDPQTNLTEQLNEKSEVFGNAQVTFFTVTTSTTLLDASARTGAESFLGQLMAKGALDVILIDKESFDVYVAQNAFLPLDEFYEAYTAAHGGAYLMNVYQYESEPDSRGNVLVKSGIYGIDVSDTTFFEGTGLTWLYDAEKGQEKTMIFCIASKTRNADKAWSFFEELSAAK
ncbi:MAG: J domain-containing protein [Clostridia bacterium]|nr:J domain-containing protein [Clostridia bacterium]